MMNQLSLQQQVLKLSGETRSRLDQLKSNDPGRDWLEWEYDQLAISKDDPQLPLEEANARLSGLKQLMHLVYEHCVKMHNPNYAEPMDLIPDSLLTVEARFPSNVMKTAREMQFSIDPTLLHNRDRENDQSDPVSPTAKIVGYLRGLDQSLRISQNFSPTTEGETLLNELGITDPETKAAMAVLFQSRYHAINAAIGKAGRDVSQIVELAAGISPRGFQWSRMSPGTIYVESDLPQLMIHKAKLVRNVLLEQPTPGKGMLHCCAADVLNRDSFFKPLQCVDTDQPFTIVSEGLLLYFGESEMRKFFSNIRDALHQHPQAAWVSDLVSKQDLQNLLASHQGVADGVRKTFALTGRSVVPNNPFENEASIQQWLDEFELRVDGVVPLNQTTSRLQFEHPIPRATRRRIVGDRKIWRIKKCE